MSGDEKRKDIKTQDVVVMYTEQHLTQAQIGAITGLTRQAIHYRLKKAGIKSQDGEWVKFKCYWCSGDSEKPRSQYRATNRHFCKTECYHDSLADNTYQPWRHGSRLARAVIAQHFDLRREHIVHHIDGNQRNNNLDNLCVYASQGDHVRAHRGGKNIVLWPISDDKS